MLVQRNTLGRPSRIFIPATIDSTGESAAPAESIVLWVDTGSPASHLLHGLVGPPIGPARTLHFGDQSRTWPSWRNRYQPGIAGLPMAGTLGADEILRQPTELDLDHGCYTTFAAVPEYAARWPSIAVEVTLGMLVSTIQVDGRPVKVLVDTGVDETIVITDEERPGPRFEVQDVYGLPVVLVRGQATLRWQSLELGEVAIDRTKSFPTFDRLGLGPTVRGMLGINSIGARRILVDAARSRILVEPK